MGLNACRYMKNFRTKPSFAANSSSRCSNRLGFYGVAELHGTREFGKDFVFSELHRLGGMRHYAAQVNATLRSSAKVGSSTICLVRCGRRLERHSPDLTASESSHVSAVYIFNSGEITAGAKDQMLDQLGVKNYGDNVHFLDGERLKALNEWSTLQTDALVRARLLGPRTALRVVIFDLETHRIAEKETLTPTGVLGIDHYLSEPVVFEEGLIKPLVGACNRLHAFEGLRSLGKMTSRISKDMLPGIADLARQALPACPSGTRIRRNRAKKTTTTKVVGLPHDCAGTPPRFRVFIG